MAEEETADIPLEIAFQGMPTSENIAGEVRRKVQKLARFRDYITSTRVAVEAAHKGSSSVELSVKFEISLPGKVIVGQKEGRPHDAVNHADALGVVRDAFDAAERRVEDYIGKHFHKR